MSSQGTTYTGRATVVATAVATPRRHRHLYPRWMRYGYGVSVLANLAIVAWILFR